MKKYVWAALSLFLACNSWAVKVTLDGHEVDLAFEYYTAPKEGKPHITYVPEHCYTTLEADQLAFVGPLCPCVLIALQNMTTQKTMVFHKHAEDSLDDAMAKATAFLSIKDPKDLRGLLYSVTCPVYKEMSPELGISLQDFHQGRTQLEELKHIKDAVLRAFSCADRRQVKATLFTPGKWSLEVESAVGDSYANVLIGADLKPKSFCYFREKLFYTPGPGVSDVVALFVTQKVMELLRGIIIVGSEDFARTLRLSPTYGSMPFISITSERYNNLLTQYLSPQNIQRIVDSCKAEACRALSASLLR